MIAFISRHRVVTVVGSVVLGLALVIWLYWQQILMLALLTFVARLCWLKLRRDFGVPAQPRDGRRWEVLLALGVGWLIGRARHGNPT